ncbi:putative methyltransferase NSUN7 [Engraulis encrasicolus]|uniref:putative methyltransferase NSUN7 n=1 Tax=Engraulis encrasicolus TaxID=184585 RepID=UPI002FD559FD
MIPSLIKHFIGYRLKRITPLDDLSTVFYLLFKKVIAWENDHSAITDHVYAHAAAIYDHAREERRTGSGLVRYRQKRETPPCTPPDTSPKEQRQAYQLALNTLKYRGLLEHVITDSCICRAQTLPDDLMGLVMVMLFDLVERKFLPRETVRGDERGPVQDVKQVEASLLRFKTKLAASLARLRIKQNLLSISDTLPETVKTKEERARTLLVHAWVNTLKSSVEDVCEKLQAQGFLWASSQTCGTGAEGFWRDSHCSDMLIFPSHTKSQLMNSPLSRDYVLNIQDKSRCLAVSAVCPMLVEDSEVLMVGSFSALTVAHMGVLASGRSARVLVCGLPTASSRTKELERTMSNVGCKNVTLLSESFLELDEWDMRMQRVRVVLLLPQCSTSALSNPLEHILNEDGDRGLLHGLSQGTVEHSKLEALASKQKQYLSHALSFPKVHAVVYCTCSEKSEENEELVQCVLEKKVAHPKLIPFRLVSPGLGCTSDLTFLRLEPSQLTNGCFLCVFAREPDPSKVESVQDVLARAAAKGLLQGFIAPLPIQKEKHRHRKKAPPMSPIPVLPELTDSSIDVYTKSPSPPSPCPDSDTLSPNDSDEEAVVLSSTKLQRKQKHSKAKRSRNKHKKLTRKNANGPAQSRSSRLHKGDSSKQGAPKSKQEVALSDKDLVNSQQEVTSDEDVLTYFKDQTASRQDSLDMTEGLLRSNEPPASTHHTFNSRPVISKGNKLVSSKHHVKKSRGAISQGSQEEQGTNQDSLTTARERVASKVDVMRARPEMGKVQGKEGRFNTANPRQEGLRSVELVLPPLALSHTRFSPSLNRLMSSSSPLSNTSSSLSSRANSAHWHV